VAFRSQRIVSAFLGSGVTVGLRAVVALVAFVVIVHWTTGDELAVYGIVSFFWSIIFASCQNLAAQPLIDMKRVRADDVASARLLAFLVAVGFGGIIYLFSDTLAGLYPDIDNLAVGLRMLLVLGPLSVIGGIDFSLMQRQMKFSALARLQTASIVLSSLLSIVLAVYVDTVLGLLCIQGLNGLLFSALVFLFRRGVALSGRPTLTAMRRTVTIGRHLVFEGNLAVFVIQGPVLLFGLILSAEQVSLYVILSRFIQLIASQLGRVANMVLLPLVRRAANMSDQLHQTVLISSFFSNGLAVTPLLIFFAMPEILLRLLNAPVNGYAVQVLMLLVFKQILDTAGNTVFSTFRAVGRPDAGWKWSLFFSFLWVAISGIAWLLDLDLLAICAIVATTGFLSLGAVGWLCRTIGLKPRRYFAYMRPVYLLVVFSLVLSVAIRLGLATAGVSGPFAELMAGAICGLVYAGMMGRWFLAYRSEPGSAFSRKEP